MPRLMPLLLVPLFSAGCGGSDTTTTSQPLTQQTTTTTTAVTTTTSSRPTTIPPISTTLPTTTSTAAADRRYVVGELSLSCGDATSEGGSQGPCVDSLFRAEPLPGSKGAAGAGCTPGTTSLPDGIWLGFVITKSATSIEFDLTCIYFGAPDM